MVGVFGVGKMSKSSWRKEPRASSVKCGSYSGRLLLKKKAGQVNHEIVLAYQVNCKLSKGEI